MPLVPPDRSKVLRSALVIVCFVVAITACDWPMAGFDSARTNFNPFEQHVNVANLGSLHQAWVAPFATANVQPVVANGVVYAASNESPSRVGALDAHGVTGCSGTPKSCTPLWTGRTNGTAEDVAVVGGTVYVGTNEPDQLLAFDAAGVNGCSGTPKTCAPLWIANDVLPGSSIIANGFVYGTNPSQTLVAFDAAGVKGCSGTPRVCTPLWSAFGGLPSVANGVVYAAVTEFNEIVEVRAFDANGVHNCSGTPKTCTPFWTGTETPGGVQVGSGAPTVAHGLVFVGIFTGADPGIDTGRLIAFDAAGVQGCSGTPKTCSAIWRAPTDASPTPAVAGDRLYETDFFFDITTNERRSTLRAFDVDACMTSRPSCSPLWTSSRSIEVGGPPVVANGVVYARESFNLVPPSGNLLAFDAAGNVNCSGFPKACMPVSTRPVDSSFLNPVIVDGALYFAAGGLHAYNVP